MTKLLAELERQFPDSAIDPQGYWQPEQNRVATDNTADGVNIQPLTQYSLLSVVGTDASKFLQGQTSCDWTLVTPTAASYGSYCNLKGRVMCSFLGFTSGDGVIQLRMRNDLLSSSQETLAKYIVFSKATLSVNNLSLNGIGISGTQAASELEATIGALPSGKMACCQIPGGSIIQLDDTGQRFECWLDDDAAVGLWNTLTQRGGNVVGTDAWALANIRAGIAEVSLATQDMFLPQMLNYHLSGAVSFKKGCYTGQEIVARMQYRGKLKRHLQRGRFDTVAPVEGSELTGTGDKQSIGNVVNAITTDTGCEALAVIADDALDQGKVYLSEGGVELSLLTLPEAQSALS